MKPSNRTLAAMAAALGLFVGTETSSFAQAKPGGSGGSSGSGGSGGGSAPPAKSGGASGGSASGGSSGSGGSAPAPKGNDSGGDRSGGGTRAGDGDRKGARAPSPPAPRQIQPNPRQPANAPTPTPPATTPPAPPTATPPTPPPTITPPAGTQGNPGRIAVDDPRRRVFPPRPEGKRAHPRREELANRPIIILPRWYNSNTWPWWFNSYFPTMSYFGDSVWNDYADRGGWYDDNYDERPGTREPRNAQATPPVYAPAPAPVAPPVPGQGTAALESDPAYRQALAEVARLQTRYDEASRKVLAKLKQDNAEYRQLLDERARAANQVEAAQEAVQASSQQGPAQAPVPDPAKVTPAAQRKLELNTRITQMEQEAIRNDPEASAARKALEQATAQVAALRKAAAPTPAPAPAPVTR